MNKVYNTQNDFARGIQEFLKIVMPNIRKTQLKIIPFIMLGAILAESFVPLDIAKKLKGDFSLVQVDSVTKRIKRFFTNKLFDPYVFYDHIIRFVINTYKKKHPDKDVHIVFDHMFSHDHFTVFMITMRIGKQGIPLWFRCFKDNNDTEAFKLKLMQDGISYVSSLFDKDFNLIFLGDRWFNSTKLMEHIDSLGHTYNLRLKSNINVYHHDKKENHKIRKTVGQLPKKKYHSVYYKNIELTDSKYVVNIAIAPYGETSEPWIIATNGDPDKAIRDYNKRFGAVECIFKNQKSNGFYIENTVNCSLKYFETMYTMACFTTLYLTILGSDFAKNSKCYKNVKIKTHTTTHGKKIRILSLFNTGLTLFNRAFESLRYIRIPYSFILYDS